MELTERDQVLLMCAFDCEDTRCNGCINDKDCADKTYEIMGQELLVRMGIITVEKKIGK